jgi:hypothetical protein
MNFVTNEQYWAAQHTEVEAIRHLSTTAERLTLAKQLFDKGFAPDYYIWILGCDAGALMLGRASVYQGLKWLPNMFSSTFWTPALIGTPAEKQAIVVSADADDPMYKPFVPPPDPIKPPSGYVGAENGGMFLAINVRRTDGSWAFNEGDPLPGGHNGQALYFHLAFSFSLGTEGVWTASKDPVL